MPAGDVVKIDVLTNAAQAAQNFTKFAKTAAKVAAAIAIAQKVFEAGAKAVAAFAEQEQAVAKLEQTLKSTGNAVNKTSEELQHLAASLQRTTKFGDEAIIGAETLLLTFKQIGGEVFPRALKSILDVSEAMGQDLKSSTIQVGKALNDPIKGLAALRRVGIQFTADQEEVIKSLVDTGRVAEAQRVILEELESQFGGVAEAAAGTASGKLKQLENRFGDILEKIGGLILKGIDPIIKFLEDLTEELEANTELWDGLAKLLKGVGNILTTVLKALKPVIDLFGQLLGIVGELTNSVAKFIKEVENNANAVRVLDKAMTGGLETVEEYNIAIKALEEDIKELEDATDKQLKKQGMTREDANRLIKTLREEIAVVNILNPKIRDQAKAQAKLQKETKKTTKKTKELITVTKEAAKVISGDTIRALNLLKSGFRAFSEEDLKGGEEAIINIKSRNQELVESFKESFGEIKGVTSTVFGALEGIWSQISKNNLQRIDNEFKARRQSIIDNVKDEEVRNKKLESLEEEFDKKRATEKRKQAAAEKAAAVIKSVIDTATAVVEALPNIPLAVTVGALGAVQTGLIAAQPIPQFAQGGSFITQGPQDFMGARVGDNGSGREIVSVTPLDTRTGPECMILQIGDREFEAFIQRKLNTGAFRIPSRAVKT